MSESIKNVQLSNGYGKGYTDALSGFYCPTSVTYNLLVSYEEGYKYGLKILNSKKNFSFMSRV